MSDLPILPYDGSSGWSGSDTSRERALHMDSSGKTKTIQQQILDALELKGTEGLTFAECDFIPDDKLHQNASGQLSTLHKAGLISRLTTTRNGRKVYVRNHYVGTKDTEDPRKNVTRKLYLDTLQELRDYFYQGSPLKALVKIIQELEEWSPKKKTN